MCGDGTNDVGSLKRADVGLAIVNNKEPTKEEKAKKKQMSPWIDKKLLEGKTWQEKQKLQMEHMEKYKQSMQAMS
jgi:magnesium-transporting ATPase (P-type)